MEIISIPFCEIRKKVISLGISEQQFVEYLMYLNKIGKMHNDVNKEATLFNARLIFHPTQEELDNEEKYLLKIISEGFPTDYQNYLSETLFSEIEVFLASGGSICS